MASASYLIEISHRHSQTLHPANETPLTWLNSELDRLRFLGSLEATFDAEGDIYGNAYGCETRKFLWSQK